jgi:hypothetical protein
MKITPITPEQAPTMDADDRNLFDAMFSEDHLAHERAREARRHTHPGQCGHEVVCFVAGEHVAPRDCFICSHYPAP